jgi:hypothetical protein
VVAVSPSAPVVAVVSAAGSSAEHAAKTSANALTSSIHRLVFMVTPSMDRTGPCLSYGPGGGRHVTEAEAEARSTPPEAGSKKQEARSQKRTTIRKPRHR